MNKADDGPRAAGQLPDLTGELMDDLARHIDRVAAEIMALSERFTINSTAHTDLTRYARRLEDRLAGGARTVSGHIQASGLQDSPTAIQLPAGPTGLGTSAARLAHRGQLNSSDRSPTTQPERCLQDIDFGCPWPVRISPFLEEARTHALAWMQEFGLTNDPIANAEQFRDWKLGEAAAYFYPDATPEGLELAADLMGWYFAPFDDQFDGELGHDPRRAAEITKHLVTILDLDKGAALPSAYPVAAGFADLWWRSCRGMSPAWQQRAAHHWRQYFIGQLAEVVNRRHGRVPDVAGCVRQRAVTTSSGPITDLIERVSGYEVPDLAWHTPVMSELRRLAGEIVGITNDLVSADKERAQGDTANNVLLILEDQQRCSRDEAIERMRQMTHERFARFLRLEQQVTDLDDILTQQGRVAIRRYVSGLHDSLAGDNEWEHTSGRYSTTKKQGAPYYISPLLAGRR